MPIRRLVITQRERWKRFANGSVVVGEDVVIPDRDRRPARGSGCVGTCPRELDHVTWYGRGPVESYPDRRRGARLGRFTQTVAEQYVPYVMPQEHGGHADTRWGVVHGTDGWGLLVTAAEPFQWNVSMFTPEQLTAATHAEDLVPADTVTMHLDARHRGLGTLSCGPDTLPEYRIGAGRYRFTWAATPVNVRRDDLAGDRRGAPRRVPPAPLTSTTLRAPPSYRFGWARRIRHDLRGEGRVERRDVHAVRLRPQLDVAVAAAPLRVRGDGRRRPPGLDPVRGRARVVGLEASSRRSAPTSRRSAPRRGTACR